MGHGSGPSGYHCALSLCFGHCKAGEGSMALPLSSVHAGGQSHSPLLFDLGKKRLIWGSRQGDAHLPKFWVLWIWDR